jgi:hypothetical protein
MKEKRTWHYVFPPAAYDVFCDKCNGANTYWSEYAHEIWCFDCEIDTKGTEGMFGGPIPIHVPYLFGITFDRYNLETKQIERFNLDTCNWDPPDVVEKNIGKNEDTKRLLKGKEPFDTYGDLTTKIGSKYFKLVPRKKKSVKCKKQK